MLKQSLLELTSLSSQVSAMKAAAMNATWTSCHPTRKPYSTRCPFLCNLLSGIQYRISNSVDPSHQTEEGRREGAVPVWRRWVDLSVSPIPHEYIPTLMTSSSSLSEQLVWKEGPLDAWIYLWKNTMNCHIHKYIFHNLRMNNWGNIGAKFNQKLY